MAHCRPCNHTPQGKPQECASQSRFEIVRGHPRGPTCRQQRCQHLQVPMPGRQVGGGVAPGVCQAGVGAASQEQPGNCQVVVPAGL